MTGYNRPFPTLKDAAAAIVGYEGSGASRSRSRRQRSFYGLISPPAMTPRGEADVRISRSSRYRVSITASFSPRMSVHWARPTSPRHAVGANAYFVFLDQYGRQNASITLSDTCLIRVRFLFKIPIWVRRPRKAKFCRRGFAHMAYPSWFRDLQERKEGQRPR
jgi:hypothetical protein